MRATPAWSLSCAAEVTRTPASAGNACGSRPGAAHACPRRSTVNHCGLPVAIARVRVSRKPAATRCAEASSCPRARPRSDTAVTVTAIAISTITASISIRVKPRVCAMPGASRARLNARGRTPRAGLLGERWTREPSNNRHRARTILIPRLRPAAPGSCLLPIPIVTVDALAARLAVAAVEQDIVLAVLTRVDVAVRMPERIGEIRGLGVRAVPRWRIQRLGDQVVQRLGRRSVVERIRLHVLIELGDADLAGIPFAGIDPARYRTGHDYADDAQQHDHREHFEKGEASRVAGIRSEGAK